MNNKEVDIEGEKVHLNKGKFGYRVVYPYKDSNGKIIWVNLLFGGWSNLIRVVTYILLALLFFIGIKELISNYQLIAADPCKFCLDCNQKIVANFSRVINITGF